MEEKTSRLTGASITFESIKSLCNTPLSAALLIPSVDVYLQEYTEIPRKSIDTQECVRETSIAKH